jgi:hypothetical protein
VHVEGSLSSSPRFHNPGHERPARCNDPISIDTPHPQTYARALPAGKSIMQGTGNLTLATLALASESLIVTGKSTEETLLSPALAGKHFLARLFFRNRHGKTACPRLMALFPAPGAARPVVRRPPISWLRIEAAYCVIPP